MPRCQRTFQRLAPAAESGVGSGRWTCSCCADAAVYETVRDTDLLQYARLAEAAAVQDFGRPDDAARNTLLLLGLRPECVLEPSYRRYDIYLQKESDALQLRLQIGHEVFHRVCSQGRIFHWTHEMLACLFSVRLLRRHGFDEYAAQTADAYRRESETCSPQTLFTTDLWRLSAYPPGFYGQAFVTGQKLKSAVGWQALCRLARFRTERGAPDVAGWVGRLPEEAKADAQRVLERKVDEKPAVDDG